MIFYTIRASIKPGRLDDFNAANQRFIEEISAREPRYLAHWFVNDAGSEVTWINVFGDAAAMQTHQDVLAETGIMAEVAPTIEPISRELFGELTPELLEELTASPMPLGGVQAAPVGGTSGRHISLTP